MRHSPQDAARAFPAHVHVAPDVEALYTFDAATRDHARRALLVLERGLINADLKRAFAGPSWASDLVKTLDLPHGHHWMFARSDTQDPAGHDPVISGADVAILRAAAGIDGPPTGNIRCTWWIRRYDRRDTSDGDRNFFLQMHESGCAKGAVATALLDKLIALLSAVAAEGGELLVEQITIVLAKDASAPLATLTPTLHADENYGPRETAIGALLEENWSPHGGAMFLPTCTMLDFDGGSSVELDDLDERCDGAPIVTPGSGDVMFYDGMIGPDGATDKVRGVPHISADRAGESARLVVLMRHVSPS